MSQHFAKITSHVVIAAMLFFVAGGTSGPALAVPTTLQPGDLVFLTVNSDGVYPGGTNANGFDVLTRVDLGAGTEIYFTDKGWDGNIPGWRTTTGEGVLRYTVPSGGQSAGSVIRYDDTMVGVSPNWTMYSMDPAGNFGAASGSSVFDLSGSGDTILVFQGSGAVPTFLAGVGLAVTNPWISTGVPTSNTSWLPVGISQAAHTAISLGNQDNYQFSCSASLGIYATNFLQQNATPGNWTSNDTVLFGPTGCVIDAIRPTATIQLGSGQASVTNSSPIVFRITTSEAVTDLTTSDIQVSGAATVTSVNTVSATVYDVVVTPTGEGTISIDLLADGVIDSAGNPNLISSGSSTSAVYDTTSPAAPTSLAISSSSDTGSSSSDGVTSDATPTITVNCESTATVTLLGLSVPLGANPSTTCTVGSASFTAGTLPDGVYALSVQQVDLAGNTSGTSPSIDVTVDTEAPSATANSTSSYSTQPAMSGTVDEPVVRISVTVNGATYTAVRSGLSWSIAAGAIAALPVGTHSISIETEDLAGNSRSQPALATITVLGDTDGDGIVDEDERAAGGSLDGNADGTPDWQQATVATRMHAALGVSMTLQLVGGSAGCGQIDRYETLLESAFSTQDAAKSYPVGFASFEATCLTPGGSADIEWILDRIYETTNWTLRKYLASSGTYVQIPGAVFESRLVGATQRTVIRFSITDGGAFDADGVVNGRIVDPSGPGVLVETPSSGVLPKTGHTTALTFFGPIALMLLGFYVAGIERR